MNRRIRRPIWSMFGIVAITATANVYAGDAVLVKGGSVEVTDADVRAALKLRVPEAQQPQFLSSMRHLGPFVEQLYLVKAAAAEARERNVHERPEIRARIERAVDEVLAKVRIHEEIEASMPESFETAARDYYKAHPEEFERPERRVVRHILIKTDERSDEEAKQLAESLRQRATADEDFAELAKEYSEDRGSAEAGGKLDPFSQGRMVKPFEQAAFDLEEGEVSPVVETRFGFHLIRLEEVQPTATIPFEKVKEKAVEKVRGKVRKEVRQDYLDHLGAGAALDEEAIRESLMIDVPTSEKANRAAGGTRPTD